MNNRTIFFMKAPCAVPLNRAKGFRSSRDGAPVSLFSIIRQIPWNYNIHPYPCPHIVDVAHEGFRDIQGNADFSAGVSYLGL